MNIDHLKLLFDYHYWVLDHLIDHLLTLPAEQLATPSPHFYHETAFKTVRHLLDVEMLP